MRYVYKITIGPHDVGKRVTVRFRTPGGGPTDAVGVLETFGPDEIAVTDKRGGRITIARETIVAAKVIAPPAPRAHR